MFAFQLFKLFQNFTWEQQHIRNAEYTAGSGFKRRLKKQECSRYILQVVTLFFLGIFTLYNNYPVSFFFKLAFSCFECAFQLNCIGDTVLIFRLVTTSLKAFLKTLQSECDPSGYRAMTEVFTDMVQDPAKYKVNLLDLDSSCLTELQDILQLYRQQNVIIELVEQRDIPVFHQCLFLSYTHIKCKFCKTVITMVSSKVLL